MSRSLPVSAQRCVNMFTEKEPQDAKAPLPLFGAPGLTVFATCGNGPVRGMWLANARLYVVSGGELYEVRTNGTATLVGSGIVGASNVCMSSNDTQVIITTGTTGYIYDFVAATFSAIADPDFFPAATVAYFDKYFVLDRMGTNQFFLSDLNNGASYTADMFASADVNPDNVVSAVNNLEQLLIFGQRSTELWYDAGGPDFPFERYSGATIERGIAGPLAYTKNDQAVFFLGDDGVFYRLQGYYPIRVSTHAIELIIAGASDLSTASCFTYTLQGHKQIVLSIPDISKTVVFDISTGLWHERESRDENGNSLGRWRGNAAVNFAGHILIGDAFDGRIGILDWTVNTEYGNTIVGVATTPPLHADRKRVFMSRFELDVEAGVGTTTGQGADPQIMLRCSDDGGHTWSQQQLWRSLGKIGQYLTRVRWMAMGSFRQRIIEVQISDPVKRTIIAAHADLTVGLS